MAGLGVRPRSSGEAPLLAPSDTLPPDTAISAVHPPKKADLTPGEVWRFGVCIRTKARVAMLTNLIL